MKNITSGLKRISFLLALLASSAMQAEEATPVAIGVHDAVEAGNTSEKTKNIGMAALNFFPAAACAYAGVLSFVVSLCDTVKSVPSQKSVQASCDLPPEWFGRGVAVVGGSLLLLAAWKLGKNALAYWRQAYPVQETPAEKAN